ncbi:MAG: glycosyltransferase family 4 protein [Ruminococcaceae bacterium]|nr:glycosyltransferase family 4 protein [Oscillospiraceae bacterium]
MKVLLYSEGMKLIKISGLGRAIMHQQKALSMNGIKYTLDPRDDYDTVHINTLGLKSKHLAKKARRAGKRVIYHAHSTEEDFRNSFICSNLISRIFKKWICSCYKQGTVIVTPTEYSKRLIRGYGVTQPIYAVSNGIDLNMYSPKAGDREAFRERYGLSDEDKVVISVGLYFERKGILDFVEMAREMPDHKFIWFGKTPLWSVPHKIRKAVKTKLPNLIFAGYVQPEELKQAYVGCDVYIFPTFEETEGIVLLEALAAKANVIVRDIPVFEWLEGGRSCYKAKDKADFMGLIRGITDSTLEALGENGRAAVEDKEIKRVGEQLARIYSGADPIAQKTETSCDRT